MIVFGLGKNLLFKSILGRCDAVILQSTTILLQIGSDSNFPFCSIEKSVKNHLGNYVQCARENSDKIHANKDFGKDIL